MDGVGALGDFIKKVSESLEQGVKTEVYFKDIIERYKIEMPDVLGELTYVYIPSSVSTQAQYPGSG